MFYASLLSLCGCMAAVGTSGAISIPKDAQRQCRSHCESIGMGLGAVAIMANNVGCVCQGNASESLDAASITAGMATIAMQEAEQQQQQRQQQARNR